MMTNIIFKMIFYLFYNRLEYNVPLSYFICNLEDVVIKTFLIIDPQ